MITKQNQKNILWLLIWYLQKPITFLENRLIQLKIKIKQKEIKQKWKKAGKVSTSLIKTLLKCCTKVNMIFMRSKLGWKRRLPLEGMFPKHFKTINKNHVDFFFMFIIYFIYVRTATVFILSHIVFMTSMYNNELRSSSSACVIANLLAVT